MLHEIAEVLYFFVPAYVANMSPDQRILGDHKTWRGLIAGVVAAVLAFQMTRETSAA